jgi:hypothetical protein
MKRSETFMLNIIDGPKYRSRNNNKYGRTTGKRIILKDHCVKIAFLGVRKFTIFSKP